MKKQSNFRVIVYPYNRIYEPKLQDALELAESIRRHCDTSKADVEHDVVCSFCESMWEVSENGCPLCCQKAVDEFEESRP